MNKGETGMKRKYSFRGLIAGFLLGSAVTAGVMTFINIRSGSKEKIENETSSNKNQNKNSESVQITVSEQNNKKQTESSELLNQGTVPKDISSLKCFPKVFSKDGYVVLRESSSEGSPVKGRISNFGCVSRISDSNGWDYVKVGDTGVSGYVHKSNVINEEKDYVSTHTVSSKDGFANVRLAASKSSKALIALPTGTEVTVFPEHGKGKWMYIGYPGAQKYEYGYIHKSILQKIK